ncbi:MAG: hypothetical protein WAV41_01780 [Microgenomates group bacterium]
MISLKTTLRTFLFAVLISLTWPRLSLAYLDPGSGSYIIQMLMAGAVGFGFVFRGYWKQVKNKLKKKPDAKTV